MRTNLQRADNGRDLAALALRGTREIDRDDYQTGLVDALTNLMHFARRHQLDFDLAVDQAIDHHAAESLHEWEEIPE